MYGAVTDLRSKRPKREAVTAEEVRALLRARFAAPEWALLFEVKNRTGSGPGRSGDALAMNLWPSRGLELHGFEIKVSRQDWLRELRRPEKSENLQQYCERWWLVAGDASIVQPGELPATWGLMVVRGRRVVATREAPLLVPMDRIFMASVLRNAAQNLTDGPEVEAIVQLQVKERMKGAEERCRSRLGFNQDESNRLKESVRLFEEASGIQINEYNGERLGEKLNALLKSDRLLEDASDLVKRLEKLTMQAREALGAVV